MNYKDFLEEYNKADDKVALLKKHLTTEYLPFETKLNEAMEIARRATTSSDGAFVRHTPMLFYLFAIRSMALYTDIEYEDSDALDMFNEFDKLEIFDIFFGSVMPPHEYNEFHGYTLQCADDSYVNATNLVTYLETKFTALNMVLNETVEMLREYVKE